MIAQRLTIAHFALAWIAALITLGVMDGVWLGLLAKGLYKREIGAVMADAVRILPAATFYAFYPVGIVFFGVQPAASLAEALLRSAAIGLLAYGTYDLSNLATLRGWSASLSLIDMAWGTFASAVAGAAAYGAVISRAT